MLAEEMHVGSDCRTYRWLHPLVLVTRHMASGIYLSIQSTGVFGDLRQMVQSHWSQRKMPEGGGEIIRKMKQFHWSSTQEGRDYAAHAANEGNGVISLVLMI